MAKAVIFLSHATPEAQVARVLKDAIQEAFLDIAEVFVSSDPRSLGAGDRWIPTITSKLHKAIAMLVLASPSSVARPWVNFEAGAVWMRNVPIIPLCHSGMTPATLPMPLLEFQGLNLVDAEHLRNLFRALAGGLGCAVPVIDVERLARMLDQAIAAVPLTPGVGLARRALRDRDLSEEREELEAEVHHRILRMQSLRTAGAKPRNPKRLAEVSAKAERFLDDPTSYAPDGPLRDLLKQLDERILDLGGAPVWNKRELSFGGVSERVQPSSGDLEQAVLKALRDMQRAQGRTNAILQLDLDEVAESTGASRGAVQDVLIDLLSAGKAEGFAETMTDRKEDGHCRITALGMASLRD